MAEALSPKYHVVVANPPYMGGKSMDSALSEFARAQYPDSRFDLFAMFMERALSVSRKHATVGMVNMQGDVCVIPRRFALETTVECKHRYDGAHWNTRI